MEKKMNGSYKAISIISLIMAIIYSVFTVFLICAAIIDFDNLVLSFAITDEMVNPSVEITAEMIEVAKIAAITFVASTAVYWAGMQAMLYVAFAKFKKYSALTDEEANKYNGRLIAWVIVLFMFSSLLLGILAIVGYVNGTKPQVDEHRRKMFAAAQASADQSSASVGDQPKEYDRDLDTMMARLEKLQRIKDMGGITDEEYEKLRKEIVNKK